MNCIPALDGMRREFRSRWPEWTALTLFAAVVAFAIPYHEPWADEAQAWQLARSLPLRELFQTYIRHEATPGLWHFLLWILIRAHVSYTGMRWICGAIAVVSTSLLVFLSPLPRYLKLTLPFTFFLLFQYAVVARSYVLVPPLLFVVAFWWKKSPLVVAVSLGLLANSSLHAAAISGGLAIVWLVEQLRQRGPQTPVRRRILPLFILIVLGFYAFAIWTAWPPSDMASTVAYVRALRPSFLFSTLAAIFFPICQPAILSIPFWILIVPLFSARRSLLFLLPLLFLTVFSGAVFCSFWHWGLVVPLLICLLWITWPSQGSPLAPAETVGRAALLWLIGTQILWSAYAIDFDHYHAYSPNLAAAQFLMPRVKAGATIAITYLDDSPEPYMANNMFSATGILPYFDRNIYINQPYPFYVWSDKNPSASLFNALLPSHPDIVIAETLQVGSNPSNDLKGKRAESLVKSGYTLTNVFCGSVPFRMQLMLTNCHVIFQYGGDAP
jgi:hypothetical protein